MEPEEMIFPEDLQDDNPIDSDFEPNDGFDFDEDDDFEYDDEEEDED